MNDRTANRTLSIAAFSEILRRKLRRIPHPALAE